MNGTPILITIFNRPDKVRDLMRALEPLAPTRLFIAADGPRPRNQTDQARCAEARVIATSPSWPCDVQTLFSDENLGVDPAMEKAISWFFASVDEGIILEDDCIPSADFFRFCTEMLERFRTDERVMMVSGNNFQNGIRRGDGSYYFSRYANTWGWATWRRAWQAYDTHLSDLPTFISDTQGTSIRPPHEVHHWISYWKKLRAGTYTPWDAKWIFAIWNKNGLCVVPNANLVQNIGSGPDATHTESDKHSLPTSPLDAPLVHPSVQEADKEADTYLFDTIYHVTFWGLLVHKLKRLFS